MIHAKAFPGWANLDAFLAPLRFIKSPHSIFLRVPIVCDSVLLPEVSKIAVHLGTCVGQILPGLQVRRCAEMG